MAKALFLSSEVQDWVLSKHSSLPLPFGWWQGRVRVDRDGAVLSTGNGDSQPPAGNWGSNGTSCCGCQGRLSVLPRTVPRDKLGTCAGGWLLLI